MFVDLFPPTGVGRSTGQDVTELLVSAAASVISALLGQGVPVGLYATGTARGIPVAVPPARDPNALISMLELLARVALSGAVTVDQWLVRTRHRMDVSVLVLAADFPHATLAALSDVHRRASVGAVWVACPGGGAPPPRQLVDSCWELLYDEDWRDRPMFGLVER